MGLKIHICDNCGKEFSNYFEVAKYCSQECYREYKVKNSKLKIITCPICGEETLNCHWICENCGWEYDGVTAENDYSSANKSTVKNYRTEYLGNK